MTCNYHHCIPLSIPLVLVSALYVPNCSISSNATNSTGKLPTWTKAYKACNFQSSIIALDEMLQLGTYWVETRTSGIRRDGIYRSSMQYLCTLYVLVQTLYETCIYIVFNRSVNVCHMYIHCQSRRLLTGRMLLCMSGASAERRPAGVARLIGLDGK
jgi:hypothetical protein